MQFEITNLAHASNDTKWDVKLLFSPRMFDIECRRQSGSAMVRVRRPIWIHLKSRYMYKISLTYTYSASRDLYMEKASFNKLSRRWSRFARTFELIYKSPITSADLICIRNSQGIAKQTRETIFARGTRCAFAVARQSQTFKLVAMHRDGVQLPSNGIRNVPPAQNIV